MSENSVRQRAGAPELGQEYPPPGEEALLKQIEQTVRHRFEQDYPPGVRPARRDAHPKAHGCVKAEFVVHGDLPEPLRFGIFREPRTYPAWIRFSSSAAQPQPDTRKDAHGMSIKLLEVEGEKLLEDEKQATTHDFVLANNKVYFVRNVPSYAHFAAAVANGKILSFFFGWNPFRWHLHEFRCMLIATQRLISNPLQVQYWSQTPYKLGPHAIKFTAKPLSPPLDGEPASSSPDYLKEAMVRQLAAGEASFDFMVQLQTDPVRMPVEDATIIWDETLSPFRTVATLHIPAQTFDTPARVEFAENLSYTPWHALPAHRPLGGINRARRLVYETISRLRHERNNAPRQEPSGSEAV